MRGAGISTWLRRSRRVIGSALRSSRRDVLRDRAAALTYYAFLAILPGLLLFVSISGFLGDDATVRVRDVVTGIAPGPAADVIDGALDEARTKTATAGTVAVVSLLVAFWSASGYVAAFVRATNGLRGDAPRQLVKTAVLRLGLTAAVGLMLIVSATIVVVSGDVAEHLGNRLGLSQAVMTAWHLGKWPVLVILVSVMVAVLYWAAADAGSGNFRALTPGSIAAVILWLLASTGYGLFVANLGAYGRTYGVVAGVVVFLVWLWLTNLALLFGALIDRPGDDHDETVAISRRS